LPGPLISQEECLACKLFLISSLIAEKREFTLEWNSVACELFLIPTRMPEQGEICPSYLHSSLTNYDYTNSFLLSAKSNTPVVIFDLLSPVSVQCNNSRASNNKILTPHSPLIKYRG
jgi:hypothetical protein